MFRFRIKKILIGVLTFSFLIGNVFLMNLFSVKSYALSLEEDPVEYAFSWVEDGANDLIDRAKALLEGLLASVEEAAESIGNDIGKIADNVCVTISDAAGAACQKICEAAGVATQFISETAGEASGSIVEAVGEAAKTIGDAADEAGKTISDAAQSAGQTIGRATNAAGETIGQAAYDATRMYEDTKQTVTEKKEDLKEEISEAAENLKFSEIDTDRIDYIFDFDNENLHFLKNSSDFVQKFFDNDKEEELLPVAGELLAEFASSGKDSMTEFLDEKLTESENLVLFQSLTDRKRTISKKEMTKVKEYLELKLKGEDAAAIEKKLSKNTRKIMEYLFDRASRADGKVLEIRSDAAEALAEIAAYGEFDSSELKHIFEGLSVKPSQIVLPEYVMKKAVGSGVVKDKMKTVLVLAPALTDSLTDTLNVGNLNLKDIDIALEIENNEESVEKAFEGIIRETFSSEDLSKKYPDMDADAEKNLAKVAALAAKEGLLLSKGDISSEDFGKAMSAMILDIVSAEKSSEKLSKVLPLIPYAYMAGSLSGSLLGDGKYESGEEVALGMLNAGGFEAMVPDYLISADEIGSGLLKKADIKKITGMLSDTVYSLSNGKICIQNEPE